jgi:hypothetical protein
MGAEAVRLKDPKMLARVRREASLESAAIKRHRKMAQDIAAGGRQADIMFEGQEGVRQVASVAEKDATNPQAMSKKGASKTKSNAGHTQNRQTASNIKHKTKSQKEAK